MGSTPRERHLLCPKKRIVTIVQEDGGTIRIEETFGLCDRQFCAAWNREDKSCRLFDYELIDDDDDDEDL